MGPTLFGIQLSKSGGRIREDKMAIFSTFSPSAMSPELIEGTFVQRGSLAERLVDIFAHSTGRQSKHNVLLIGPRGIGKSHLVSLVYHRLKAKPELADKVCIAYLKEDEWGINSFLDLLMRTLSALKEEASLPINTIGNLPDEGQAEAHVWKLLQDVIQNKTLLLIVENLDSVFRKIGDHGQKQWRALIQTHPQWAILATTPALFSGVSRQISPFYGFFEVIYLQPLSFDDALALLQRLSALNRDEETTAFLETAVGRARVRAVQHLAGGNHRIFVLFYDFLNQSGSQHFVTPLLKTVDALTPYYQSQMERLSPQQQKIVNFLCEHRKPATVTTIASGCFTTHQTAASQLKQLLSNRYVRVDRIGRESFYELTEPLLRICVETKTHHERPLNLLVDFIRYWFSREELEHRLSAAGERDPGRPYFIAALREYDAHDGHTHLSPEIASLCRALHYSNAPSSQIQKHAQELAELSRIAEDWDHFAQAMIWLKRGSEAIPILEKQIKKDPENTDTLRSLASVYSHTGSADLAEEFINRAINLQPRLGELFYDKGAILAQADRNLEALEAFDKALVLRPDLAPVVAAEKARVLLDLEEYKAMREVLLPFLNRGTSIRRVFVLYGLALAYEGEVKPALEYFDKGTQAFEHDATAWANKGLALSRLERDSEAIEALERSVAEDPTNKGVLRRLCEVLVKTKQYRRAVELGSPETLSHNMFHELLGILNRRPSQKQLQDDLLGLDVADNSEAWRQAMVGGLTEFASYASDFSDEADIQDLKVWNTALRETFGGQPRFTILLNLFDVLTRLKAFGDKKALLDLPREQRLLLTKGKEESFTNSN